MNLLLLYLISSWFVRITSITACHGNILSCYKNIYHNFFPLAVVNNHNTTRHCNTPHTILPIWNWWKRQVFTRSHQYPWSSLSVLAKTNKWMIIIWILSNFSGKKLDSATSIIMKTGWKTFRYQHLLLPNISLGESHEKYGANRTKFRRTKPAKFRVGAENCHSKNFIAEILSDKRLCFQFIIYLYKSIE